MIGEYTEEELLIEKAVRGASTRFKNFIAYTMGEYSWGWFNEYLATELQQFLDDYNAGKNPRLMIFAPPRSGKSEQASRRLPAWILGVMNHLDIVACSYAQPLANRMSRDVKRIIQEQAYRQVFPDTNLPISRGAGIDTTELWEVTDRNGDLTGGTYRASGVGGGITGQGFDIGIIDDPVKDYKDASSPAMQATNKEWYDTTFYTRRDPLKNGIILIMTRWHKQDLGGKLLEEAKNGGDQWKVISFPMEAEETEVIEYKGKKYVVRRKGDILFPERMPPDFVKACKNNSLTWDALYQQRPTIAGGNFFKTQWFGSYSYLPTQFEQMIITADTAQKTGREHDYTVFQVWGKYQNQIYLVDQKRGKWESHGLRKTARQLWEQYGGGIQGQNVRAYAFYIEDKVSGTGLVQDLINGGYDEDGRKWDGIPCIPIQRNIDKAQRAHSMHAHFMSGMILLPTNAPWVNEYLMEFEEFTLDDTHSFDDQVDPTLDAVDILLVGNGAIDYGGYTGGVQGQITA